MSGSFTSVCKEVLGTVVKRKFKSSIAQKQQQREKENNKERKTKREGAMSNFDVGNIAYIATADSVFPLGTRVEICRFLGSYIEVRQISRFSPSVYCDWLLPEQLTLDVNRISILRRDFAKSFWVPDYGYGREYNRLLFDVENNAEKQQACTRRRLYLKEQGFEVGDRLTVSNPNWSCSLL